MKMKVHIMTLCMGILLWVKHSEKICNLCGGYLMSMNFHGSDIMPTYKWNKPPIHEV
jgi:hypothetical protein